MAREGVRLRAYRDSVGVPTIGVGHTGRATPPSVRMGMTITAVQADEIFTRDLAPFEAAVNAALKRPVSQNAFDACVSLAFNIGERGFTGSTVVHKIDAGDMPGAADAFLMWNKPAELVGRRRAERAQFLTPDAASSGGPAQPTLHDSLHDSAGASMIAPPCTRPDCPLHKAA